MKPTPASVHSEVELIQELIAAVRTLLGETTSLFAHVDNRITVAPETVERLKGALQVYDECIQGVDGQGLVKTTITDGHSIVLEMRILLSPSQAKALAKSLVVTPKKRRVASHHSYAPAVRSRKFASPESRVKPPSLKGIGLPTPREVGCPRGTSWAESLRGSYLHTARVPFRAGVNFRRSTGISVQNVRGCIFISIVKRTTASTQPLSIGEL